MTATRHTGGSRVATIAGVAGALLSSACGVASVAGVSSRTDQRVVATVPSVERSPGDIVARDVRWVGDRLRANVEREIVCRDYATDEYRSQDVRVTVTRNVGGEAATGAGLLVLAGVALAIAPGLPSETTIDPDTGAQQMSKQDGALLSAVVAGVLGVSAIGHALTIRARGGTRRVGDARSSHQRRATRSPRVCDREPAPPGRLVYRFGDELAAVDAVADPTAIDVDLRAGAVCADPSRLSVPLTITWEAHGSSVVIATHDADACIEAHVVGQRLDRAEAGLAAVAAPRQLDAVVAVLDDAADHLAELATDDPAHAEHDARLSALRTRAAAAAATLLGQARAAFQSTLDAQAPVAAIDAAAEALTLGRAVPGHERETWDAVYLPLASALAREGADGLPTLAELLTRDPATASCLAGRACPAWLERAVVVTALAPLARGLNSEVERATSDVDRKAARLRRKVTEASFDGLRGALESADQTLTWCSSESMWDATLVAACGRLREQAAASVDVAAAAEDAARRIRITRTARAWRAIFPQCLKVKTVIDAIQREGECSGQCQAIVRRATADWQRLATFAVDGDLDDETAVELRADCAAAGCPTCP